MRIPRLKHARTMPHAYATHVNKDGQTQENGKCDICGLSPKNTLHTRADGSVLIANRAFLERALDNHIFWTKSGPIPSGFTPPRSARCTLCGLGFRAKRHRMQGTI